MNRLLLVCLSVIVCFLASCTDKDKIPAGVLPKDKMEVVLWDMIQAERFRESFIRDSSKDLKAETFTLYAQVFQTHNISRDEFIKSYKFYMSRPDIARDMFDSLSTKANRRREELYKPKADTAKVQQPATPADSAKAAPLQPVIPAPVLPKPANSIKPGKQPAINRFKLDSLRRLQKKQ